MRTYWTLVRRELASYFVSFSGYVIMAGAVFLMGLSFVTLMFLLGGDGSPVSTSAPITQLYYSTPYFWLVLLLSSPVITMRLFALEKFSGTFETLMTAPVSDMQVVLAKFTAAMVFYVFLWLPSVAFVLILHHYTNHRELLDWGLIGGAFLGITLLGGLFMSLGCFASALTKSQIIAAMISFTSGFTLFLLSFLPDSLRHFSTGAAAVVAHVAMFDHMNDFARGLINTEYVVFYVSLTVLFLFLTLRVVESRRWK